jgi:hypothetical protein
MGRDEIIRFLEAVDAELTGPQRKASGSTST